MTLDELVNQYNGQSVEEGGSVDARFQCVDLANLYISKVLGFPKILWTNAIDFPSKADGRYLYIKNTRDNVPQKGDLMIFALGNYGHISVFLKGDVNSFDSWDQNFPVGSYAHIQRHTYIKDKVMGWMRPVKVTADPNDNISLIITDQTRIPQIDNKEVQAIRSELRATHDRVGELDQQIQTAQQNLLLANSKYTDLKTEYEAYKAQNLSLAGISNSDLMGELSQRLMKKLKISG